MSNKIRTLVKHYVKETLAEVLAELHLETIVEGIVAERVKKQPARTLMEAVETVSTPQLVPAPAPISYDARNKLDSVGVDESEWKAMYADIADSGNPILRSGAGGALTAGESVSGAPEVSELALTQLGLFKDYSKFVPKDKSETSTEDKEFEKLREERAAMLKAAVKQ